MILPKQGCSLLPWGLTLLTARQFRMTPLSLGTEQVTPGVHFSASCLHPPFPSSSPHSSLRRWEKQGMEGPLSAVGQGTSARALSLVALDSCVFSFAFIQPNPCFSLRLITNSSAFLLAGRTKLVCRTQVIEGYPSASPHIN